MDVLLGLRLALFLRCAGALIFAVSLSAAPAKELKTWHVEIEALGQANPKSHGDEVWVYEVRTPQEVLDWNNIKQTGAQPWEFRPRPNASGGRAALATGPGPRVFQAVLHGDSLTVKAIQHAWSGRVKITVNGEARTLDLYSAAEPAFVVESFGTARQGQPAPKPASDSGRNARAYLLGGGLLFVCVAIWAIWRRSRNGRSAPHGALIAGLAAIPVSPILAHVIFGAAPGALALALAFLYSFGLFFGVVTFWRLCKSPATPDPAKAAPQGRLYWGTAIAVSAIMATIVVTGAEDSLNKQHAYWVKLLIETTSSQPPQLAIRYGSATDEVESLRWQPFSQAILSIKRLSARRPLRPSGSTLLQRMEDRPMWKMSWSMGVSATTTSSR